MRSRATRLSATGNAGRAGISIFLNSAASYSVRVPAGSVYRGPLLRVRRSGDNAERDIFSTHEQNASGDRWLDEGALLSFVGGGSGFVSAWYDQSGRGRHATQTIAADQPRIVNAGVIETVGGRPCLNFDAFRRLVYTGYSSLQPFDVITAVKTLVPPGYAILFDGSPGASGSRALTFLTRGDLGNRPSIFGGTNAAFGYALANNTGYVLRWSFNGASSSSAINGTNYAGLNPGSFGIDGGFMLGNPFASTTAGSQIGELILTASALLAGQRLLIERSQGAAFGITVA